MPYLGLKRKVVRPLGQKIKQAERLGLKTGKALQVGGRKLSNVAGKVERVIGSVQPEVAGTPLEGVATIARDLAASGRVAGKVSRKAGRNLEKISERGLVKSAQEKLKQFADENDE
ncbi:MAG: hypothetical protein ACO3UU_04390 [Minisyncoccia bacterium]